MTNWSKKQGFTGTSFWDAFQTPPCESLLWNRLFTAAPIFAQLEVVNMAGLRFPSLKKKDSFAGLRVYIYNMCKVVSPIIHHPAQITLNGWSKTPILVVVYGIGFTWVYHVHILIAKDSSTKFIQHSDVQQLGTHTGHDLGRKFWGVRWWKPFANNWM
jgi:hypothetical protein